MLQLNYNDSKQAINKLKRELQMTLFLYNHIRKHVENTNNLNFECLSGRAFLVMQFINFISDLELLDNLPITLRGNFEKKFEDNLSSNPVATDFSKYLEIIKNSPTVDIQNLPFPYYIEYKEVIDKFKNSISKNQNEHMFFLYFESKNISEEDLFNHFEEVFNDLINNTIEDLILRDRDVEIIKKEFKIL